MRAVLDDRPRRSRGPATATGLSDTDARAGRGAGAGGGDRGEFSRHLHPPRHAGREDQAAGDHRLRYRRNGRVARPKAWTRVGSARACSIDPVMRGGDRVGMLGETVDGGRAEFVAVQRIDADRDSGAA